MNTERAQESQETCNSTVAETPARPKRMKNLKRFITLGIVCVIIVVGVLIGLSLYTNNYTVPVKTMEKYYNTAEYSIEKACLDYGNGLGKGIMKKLYSLLHNSDEYMDDLEDTEDYLTDNYYDKWDQYGDDYLLSYEILGKVELSEKELRNYRTDLQYTVDIFEDIADESEDYDSDDWRDVADELGLTKEETKEFVELCGKLADELGRLNVTEGYELEVVETITGSALEEPIEKERTFYVLKVNGRWIAYNNFDTAFSFWH